MTAPNWRRIAKRDQELRESVDHSSASLAKHRYDNTIGAGVAFREYARQCGVTVQAVASYAKAHELLITDRHLTIADAIVRASSSTERADVIEAVATARGTSSSTIRAHHGDEVRTIRAAARERAEQHGTSVAEEARALAEMRERQRRADANRQDRRRRESDARFLDLEHHLQRARRSLQDALRVEVELGDEHRELLQATIRNIVDLAALCQARFVELVTADWDSELARLIEGDPLP